MDRGPHAPQQRAGRVTAVIPVHDSLQAFRFQVLAFEADGFGIVIADEAAPVEEERRLRLIVPVADKPVFVDEFLGEQVTSFQPVVSLGELALDGLRTALAIAFRREAVGGNAKPRLLRWW